MTRTTKTPTTAREIRDLRVKAKDALDARATKALGLVKKALAANDPLTTDRLMIEAACSLHARTMTEKTALSTLSFADRGEAPDLTPARTRARTRTPARAPARARGKGRS